MTGAATFYTVSDERFFVGTVCLVNSLRLTGHEGEIVVLDLGLTQEQRRRLGSAATVIDRPPGHGPVAMTFKPFPALLEPKGVVVIVDSDMIVTRSLDPVIERAAAGEILLFSDLEAMRTRWFAEWEQLFGLAQPPRRQEYLNAGFLAMSVDHFPDLLTRWWNASEGVPRERTLAAGARGTDPLCFSDQDALNALLMSEVPADSVVGLPHKEAPSARLLASVEVLHIDRLTCRLNDHLTYLLHYWGGPKPWEATAWMRVERNAYVRLMPRLLFASDAPVPLPPEDLPRWLRPGRANLMQLRALSAANSALRWGLDKLSPEARRKAARMRKRLVA